MRNYGLYLLLLQIVKILCALNGGDMLLIVQLQEVIKYLSKANNSDIRKSLVELNWNDFYDFLSKIGTDRLRMSKYLESVVQSQRYFSELPREINSSDPKSPSAETTLFLILLLNYL